MKEMIEYIVKGLVEFPEQVTVTMVEAERTTVIELGVAQSDLGKVIGKQGKMAKALRTVLAAVGTKEGKRIILEIVE
ncbi:KH domain-containing protein [Chrysiogenes arsenatis]|uniref:KH domain-containing protein n=1 Tax=Chrysiogenes arsenatis TaxID=309797 RepID=UPI0004073C59